MFGLPVGRKVCTAYALVPGYIIDDINLTCSHEPRDFGTERRHGKMTNDARSRSPRVVAGNGEVVLVGLDLGVGATVSLEMFAEQPCCGRYDVTGVAERPQGDVQLGEKSVVDVSGHVEPHILTGRAAF